ncbi:Testis-expressed protein 11 [Desmophyllum pertusum]|uniref:Protein ZIP4 homolog n=1 Tax=Desmophyllum pertusum TaxID=174260 RepID=A0A9X0D6L4_9CNID|nr:Testis-expressed protein 11 [Desmophyllum pertusum]
MTHDSVDDIGKVTTLLQALVKDLRQNQSNEERVTALADRITNLANRMHQLAFDRTENNAALIQMHSCAVTLWNIAVAMKTGGQSGTTYNARLRHAACKLSFLANATETSEVTYRKQLVCWDGLQKLWSSRGEQDSSSTAEQSKQITESERYMFRVFCYRAEAGFSLNHQDEAKLYVIKAKELLARLPAKEVKGIVIIFFLENGLKMNCVNHENHFVIFLRGITLAELCYNFGVDTYYREEYENCISWLRESYDLRKGNNPFGAKKQEYGHPAGLYLKAKLLITGNGDETFPSSRLQSAFEETLQHPDLKVDLGLCAVNLAVQYKRTELAFDCLKVLATRFKNSPDLYKIQLEHLELLLKHKKDEAAKELIENCIVDQIGTSLDSEMCQRFHILLWEKAAAAYEGKDYNEALNWYNYSLSMFSSKETNGKNIGKLQRNKCSSYMNLQDYEKAKEAIVEAEQSDPESPVIYFYKFKIALMEGEDDTAVDAMTKMSEVGSRQYKNVTETDAHGLICLAAQLALEQKNHKVAVSALEKVVATSSDNQQVLTSLRCLTRLKLTQCTDSGARKGCSSFLQYLQTALDRLNQMQQVGDSDVQAEATWFMKIAWNLALESTESSLDMQELFLLCYKFSCLCPTESSNLVRQKNCLVDGSCMCGSSSKRTEHWRSREDESMVLLTLYEFEAKAQLGDSDLSFVSGHCGSPAHTLILVPLKPLLVNNMYIVIIYTYGGHGQTLTPLSRLTLHPVTCTDVRPCSLPLQIVSNFLVINTALAVESPAYYREISMRALRVAIKKHLAMDVVDFTKLSKAFHSLVHHALSSGSSSDAESKEEALAVYQDICEIIENQAKSFFKIQGCYPEMQILWLMTSAWNCGINLFSASKHEAGEKWCALAMRPASPFAYIQV